MSAPTTHARRHAAGTSPPSEAIGRANTLHIGTIGGIRILVHWTWLLAFIFLTWTLGAYYNGTFKSWGPGTAYLLGALSTVLLFATVLLHELGHSFTARSLGLPVTSITLFIFGGVSNLTEEPQSPRVELLVTAAGPLVSLGLAGIFYLLHAVSGGGSSQTSAVLGYLASVNLILAIFNLIPAFPLDGGRVLRSVVWGITGSMQRATTLASTIGQVFAYLFIGAGLLEVLLLGQIIGGLWLAFIGWFLHTSSSASAQRAVLDRILRGVSVAAAMDPAPRGIAPTVPIQSLLVDHLLSDRQRATVVQDRQGAVLGLVTLSDLRDVPQEEWTVTPVTRIMTPAASLATVAPRSDLRQAIDLLATTGYHQLPVLEDGNLVGMLNRDHVMQYLQVRELRNQQSSARHRPPLPPSRR